MKIKEQSRELATDSSKHYFEAAHKTDEVSSKHCFEVVDKTDEVSNISTVGQCRYDLLFDFRKI